MTPPEAPVPLLSSELEQSGMINPNEKTEGGQTRAIMGATVTSFLYGIRPSQNIMQGRIGIAARRTNLTGFTKRTGDGFSPNTGTPRKATTKTASKAIISVTVGSHTSRYQLPRSRRTA